MSGTREESASDLEGDLRKGIGTEGPTVRQSELRLQLSRLTEHHLIKDGGLQTMRWSV